MKKQETMENNENREIAIEKASPVEVIRAFYSRGYSFYNEKEKRRGYFPLVTEFLRQLLVALVDKNCKDSLIEAGASVKVDIPTLVEEEKSAELAINTLYNNGYTLKDSNSLPLTAEQAIADFLSGSIYKQPLLEADNIDSIGGWLARLYKHNYRLFIEHKIEAEGGEEQRKMVALSLPEAGRVVASLEKQGYMFSYNSFELIKYLSRAAVYICPKGAFGNKETSTAKEDTLGIFSSLLEEEI